MTGRKRKMKSIYIKDLPSLDYPVGNDMNKADRWAIKVAAKIRTIRVLKGKEVNILCSGSSGSILAALVSRKLKTFWNAHLVYIRKDGETSHGGSKDGFNLLAKTVIIDDFISSGETVSRIYSKIGITKVDLMVTMNANVWLKQNTTYQADYAISKD